MQNLIIALALLFSSTIIAQETNDSTKNVLKTITVSVVNATSDNGEIRFALFDKENFRKESIKSNSSSIENGIGTVTFMDVPKGDYAIICYHDENENNRMDFYENGIPKENFGASNNVLNFGPPQFETSKISVKDKDLTLEIKF